MKTYLSAAFLAIIGLLLIFSPLVAHARVIGEADSLLGGKIVLLSDECVRIGPVRSIQYMTFGTDGRATSAGCVTTKPGSPYIWGRGNYGEPVRWLKSDFTWHCDNVRKTC